MKKQIISVLLCFILLTVTGLQMLTAKQKIILWDIQTTGVLKDKIDSTAKEFNEKNQDYEIEVVHIQNDQYKTKIKVEMGGGNPPDIFHNWGGGWLKEYIDSGMVAPIDSIKPTLLKTYIPGSFDPATFGGKTYASAYAGLTGVYIFYRKDIFAKYKLTPPKNWKELLNVCATLKKNGIIPFSLANKTKWTGSFYYMYLADRLGGGDMFLNALYRQKGVTFNDNGYVQAGEKLQELVNKGYFPEGVNGLDEDSGTSRQLIYTGKAGMLLMGNWFLGNAKKEAPELLNQIDFFNFPAVEGGKGDPSNLIGSPGQNFFSITANSKVKEGAMKFLTDYIMNQSYIEFLGAGGGYVPPVKNAASYVSDPFLKKVAQTFEQAKHVQLYYDQFLSPEMAQVHLDAVQALFGLSMTPKDAAAKHEEALLKELKK